MYQGKSISTCENEKTTTKQMKKQKSTDFIIPDLIIFYNNPRCT